MSTPAAGFGKESPIHFGSRSTFGFYHAAATNQPTGAVLLCPPIGQDQIRSHRLYRQLAHALVADGCAVLRFDCYGTGDSPGDAVDVDWNACVADAVAAAAELRARSGCRAITAYGARLGANLAAAVADDDPAVARVVAWEPVWSGADFVAQLDAWQDCLWRDPDRYSHRRTASEAAGQWLGFEIGRNLRPQLAALLFAPAHTPTTVIEPADSQHGNEPDGFAQVTLSTPSPWNDFERLETTVLAPDMIRAVCVIQKGPH